MTTPSIRFVMEQARVPEAEARRALMALDLSGETSTPTAAVWLLKREAYTQYRFRYTKPHIYLAQYPLGKSYWRVCGSENRRLNVEANLACNELNHKHHHEQATH